MTPDSPLRAQADSRFTDADSTGMQASLFDTDAADVFAKDNNVLLNDYRQRYGLSEDPFSDDPGFPLFTGGGRRQVLDQLLHLCQFSHNLLLVTGELGVGKTRLAHALADSLEEQDQLCFLALNPGQTLEQLLVAIAESFSLPVPSPVSVESLLGEIEQFIEDSSVGEGNDADGLILMIIDNAEHLDSQSVAVLASLVENKPQSHPLHIVLVGEPRLVSKLNGIESETLQISDFHLPALSLSETVDYLNFRMEMADYLGPEIFTDALVDPWWRQSRGQLNLVHEYAQDRLLQSVMPQEESRRSHLPVFHIVAISAVIAVAGVFYLYLDDKAPAENVPVPVIAKAPAVSAQSSVVAVANTSVALTDTQAPIQPILPSLPNTVDTLAQTSTPALANDSAVASSEAAITPTPEAKVVNDIAVSEISSSALDETLNNNPPAASVQNLPRASEPKVVKAIEPVGRYTSHENTILSWVPKQFTIQLLGVSSLKSAQEFVRSQANKSELLIFKTKRSGKDWFVVVTGHYPSNAQARAAISSLPAEQREAGPWPRQIQTIQDEIRQ